MYARLPGMAYRCLNDDHRTLLEVAGQTDTLTGLDADSLVRSPGPVWPKGRCDVA